MVVVAQIARYVIGVIATASPLDIDAYCRCGSTPLTPRDKMRRRVGVTRGYGCSWCCVRLKKLPPAMSASAAEEDAPPVVCIGHMPPEETLGEVYYHATRSHKSTPLLMHTIGERVEVYGVHPTANE